MALSASVDEDVLSQRSINHYRRSSLSKQLNQMDKIQHVENLDPLQALPPEIWSEVLRYTVSNDTEVVPDLVLSLTTVSRSWLHAIVSTPFLWTTIVLDDTDHRELHAIIEACLHLSHDRLLSVILRNLEGDLEDILPMIAAHSHRIGTFRLDVPTSHSAPLRDVTNGRCREAINALGVMPNLLHLHWHSSDESIKPSNLVQEKQCFRLQTVAGISLTRADIISGLFHDLRTITISTTMGTILSDLQQMPHLEHVKNGNSFVFQAYKASNPDEAKQYPKELEEIRWKTLQWNEVGNPLFTKVLRATSNLQELNVGVNWQGLPDLLSDLANTTRLQTLKLVIRLPANRQFDPPPLPPSRELRYLNLIFLSRPWRGVEGPFSSLFRTLTTWASNVEYLSMRLSTSDTAPFDYIESLRNLHSLKLSTKSALIINDWVPNLDPGTMAELELTAPTTLRKVFVTPSTRQLTLKSSSTMSYALDEPIEPEPDQTANIASLSLHKFNCNLRPFTGLCKLTIEGLQYVSNYLMIMIAFPSQCHQLEELCIQDTPEWDLVFLMLERRNIQPPTPVSPIGILTVPVIPGPSVMKPLVARLGCRSIRRPSNIDLSSQGFQEIFFDFNLNGCQTCIRNFKACDSQVITPAYSHSLHAMPNLTKIPQEYEAPCPPDVWLWIEKRKARADAWNQLSNHGTMFTRVINCHKQREPRFRITELTSPGESCLERFGRTE